MEYLLWLQDIRSDALNTVLITVTDFITSPVMYLAMAILYWCFNKKAAYYIAMNISFGSMVNQALKNTFCVYRPWIKNPHIKPVPEAFETATGYSFPSGHTQIASSEFLSVAVWQKNRKWIVGLCVFITFLVMFTRNYLGVHTLADVFASLAVSAVVLFLTKKLLDWVDGKKNRDLIVFFVGMAVCTAFLIYTTLKPYPTDFAPDGKLLVDSKEMITDCYAAAGCVYGFLIGWICERRFVNFRTEVSAKTKIVRSVVGSVILLIIATVVRDALTVLHMWWGELVAFVIAFVYILYLFPAVFSWIERKKISPAE